MFKPQFTHDCDHCTFIWTTDGSRRYDWYVCDNLGDGKVGSVIGRYGDDGPEYVSHPIMMVDNDEYLPVRATDENHIFVSDSYLLMRAALQKYRATKK